jgi:ABC-2 type transport system permease protein
MATYLADTLHLLKRHLRESLRMPIWVIVSLAQPMIWLTLYGQLFRRMAERPQFGGTSYIAYLTPGIVVMTAVFGAAFSGMALVEEIGDGVLDRMLTTRVNYAAIITARMLHAAIVLFFQSVIVLGVGFLLGVRAPGGLAGIVAMVLAVSLLATGTAALSNGLALLTRRDEPLVALLNLLAMPLMFLSSAFMAADLMPGWMRTVASVNPVEWSVNAARRAMLGNHWGQFWVSCLCLVLFTLVAGFAGTRALRVYRSAS